MPPEHWERVKELFDGAQVQPSDLRMCWLAGACQEANIREEVESLLASYENAGGFIERPPATELTAALARLSPATLSGHILGPWQLVDEIGHGGMGAVWRAISADGAFDKQVAVKLITRGGDTQLLVRRFHQERQILASLDHPNIAILLDGGTAPDGLPYFVMEYVEGQPITTYCKEHALPLRARLELFCTVCHTVEHAHRKRIVHRDLKPSNILVTPAGTPKLLDFGIARVLHAASEDALTATASAPMQLLTPEYASPEQVRAEPASESTDVYSLGVLLYELVAGCRPYQFQTKSPEEISKVVCEKEPVKPSTVARRPELRGELDSIVMMALRKEARFRYGSVTALSTDLQNYLNGRPLQAARRTAGYRARRFLRRRGAAVATGSALLVAAGLLVWQSTPAQAPPTTYRRSPVLEANGYYERAVAVDNADWDLLRMIGLLQRAVELDPNFTAARSRYGFYQLLMVDGGLSNDAVWLDRAETELKRVEREDPNFALNHAYLAGLNLYRRRWDDVEKHCNTAARLHPAEVEGRMRLIVLSKLRGDWPQAMGIARQMLEREPAWWPGRMALAGTFRCAGELEASIREYEKTLGQNARSVYPIAGLASAHLDRGDTTMARQTLGRARSEDRGNYLLRLAWALLLACQGDAGAARRETDQEVLRWAELFPESPAAVADVYSVVGDTENALAWLHKGVRAGDRRLPWFRRDPHLANTRTNPRFQQVLDAIPPLR